MLDVNNVIYQHLTNDRKDEEFDFDDFLSEIDDRKESEEGRMLFSKQNVR